MSQIAAVPAALLRHNRSLLPSPLKSPVPASVQLDGTVAKVFTWSMLLSFMIQMDVAPAVLRNTMSLLWSPLKSPTPRIVQLEGTEPSDGALMMVPLFMSQIAAVPAALLRHNRSL